MRDLSDLPPATAEAGNPPNPQPHYAQKLAEAWAAKLDDGKLNMAHPDARMRHSDGGKCARQLGYKLSGTPEDKPMDLAGRWITGLGSIVHARWQEAMLEAFPDAEVEKKVFIEECKSAGHVDLFMVDKFRTAVDDYVETKVSLELKTVNGFGFKKMIGSRGPAEGPRTSYIFQSALNGYATDADEIVIVLLAMENLSTREAESRYGDMWEDFQKFCAEWTFTKEQYWDLAVGEVARFAAIQEVVDKGELPPRAVPMEMPKGARIVDPSKGNWTLIQGDQITQTGSYWGCGYCPWQPTCIADKLKGC